MRAAGGLEGDFRKAEGAFLGGGFFGRGLFFALHAVDAADQQEDGECHDQKSNHSVDEQAIVHGDRAGFLGKGQGRMDRKSAKIATIRRCEQLGWYVTNDNEADACALWDYTCARLRAQSTSTPGGLFDNGTWNS